MIFLSGLIFVSWLVYLFI